MATIHNVWELIISISVCFVKLLAINRFVLNMGRGKHKSPAYSLFVGAFLDAIQKGKHSIKGTRQSAVNVVCVVGGCVGVTSTQFGQIINTPQPTAYARLKRGVKDGYLFRSGHQYYLTDKGRIIYSAVENRIGERLRELYKNIREDALRNLKTTGKI